MDPDSLKILGVIIGAAVARWIASLPEGWDRGVPKEPVVPATGTTWYVPPRGPSLAMRLGRLWGRLRRRASP